MVSSRRARPNNIHRHACPVQQIRSPMVTQGFPSGRAVNFCTDRKKISRPIHDTPCWRLGPRRCGPDHDICTVKRGIKSVPTTLNFTQISKAFLSWYSTSGSPSAVLFDRDSHHGLGRLDNSVPFIRKLQNSSAINPLCVKILRPQIRIGAPVAVMPGVLNFLRAAHRPQPAAKLAGTRHGNR